MNSILSRLCKLESASGTGGGSGAFVADGSTRITPATPILLNQITGDETALTLNYTTYKTAGNDTGLLINQTDTASPGTSKLLDLQVGGVSKLSVASNGLTEAVAFLTPGYFANLNGSTLATYMDRVSLRLNSGAELGWTASTSAFSTRDLSLWRDAAGTLGLRNGVNAQTFNIYNTYTNATNYERGHIGWNDTADTFVIGAEAGSGGGTVRNIRVDVEGGSNIALVADGLPRLVVERGGILALRQLQFSPDNTYDIGGVGIRPRTAYLGTTLDIAQGTLTDDAQALNLTSTWNDAADTFTLIKADVTNTASAAGSKLLDLQVGGTSKFSVSNGGNVGIGTAAPSRLLEVAGQSHTGIRLYGAGNGTHTGVEFFRDALGGANRGAAAIRVTGDTSTNDTGLDFIVSANTAGFTASLTAMRIGSDGNVGIGTATPSDLLELSSADDTTLKLTNTDISLIADQVASSIIFHTNDASTGGTGETGYIKQISENAGNQLGMAFGTSTNPGPATERMRIGGYGNVGIGTATPGTKLDVYDDSVAVGTSFNVKSLSPAATSSFLNDTDNGVSINTYSSTYSSGTRLGVGADGSYIGSTGKFGINTGAGSLTFGTVNAARMTIDTSGDVGMGTTTPTAALQVIGNIHGGTGCTATFSNFIGTSAGQSSSGNYCVGIGDSALENNTSSTSVAVGYKALRDNVGISSVGVGHNAGLSNLSAGLTAVGYQSAKASSGTYRTAIGYESAFQDSGTSSTFIGYRSGFNNVLNNCTGVGYSALQANTAANCAAVGYSALANNTASNSTAVGYAAMLNNTGAYSVGIGGVALSGNSGVGNSAVGYGALHSNTGSYNVGVGYQAGQFQSGTTTSLTTAAQSVFIGRYTRGVQGAANQVVIGNEAQSLGANSVVLGNDLIVTTALRGNVGIGTTTPSEKLDVVGNITASGTVKTTPTTVALLPAAATAGAGARTFVTDSANTLSSHHGQAVAGGGSNFVPVFSDGTNWITG